MAAAFLANFVFWSGLSIGGVVFAALVDVTGGQWLGDVRDTAERFRRFLPLSFALFLLLMWRSADVYPSTHSGGTAPSSRHLFVMMRDTAAIVAVYGSAFAYCRVSRQARADAHARRATTFAIGLVLVYAVGFSLLVVDLLMTLEPRWNSTLFPAYVFTGNVYSGVAAIATIAAWSTDSTAASSRTRDIANVLVGLALFWLYLFWSQFLVIWYGNITSEVGFLTMRVEVSRVTGWMVLALCCAIPAIVLVPQWGKQRAVLRVVAPLILIGFLIERWLLVAPSLPASTALGGIATTAAFGVAFAACVLPGALPLPRSAQRRSGGIGGIGGPGSGSGGNGSVGGGSGGTGSGVGRGTGQGSGGRGISGSLMRAAGASEAPR